MQAELLPINFNVKNFNFQVGLRWDYIHYRNKLESETSQQIELKNKHFYSYRARINYNSEDKWYFPSRGARFKAEYAYLTDNMGTMDGKAGISDISAHWRKSFTLGGRFTIQPMVYGRLLLGPSVPYFYGNTIGGEWFEHYIDQQMPFAGVGNVEYIDKQFIAAQLQFQQRIGTSHYILLRAAGGQQAGKLKEIFDHKTLIGGQLAYYFNTMFGPIGASVGYSNRTKKAYFYLNLGFEF